MLKNNLTQRKAKLEDLEIIISLLAEDELGVTRESVSLDAFEKYQDAFEKINDDPNQYLMVVLNVDNEVIATCHLTIMPSLTFIGATRMQIEAVRVLSKCQGQKIGHWMIQEALNYAKKNNVKIVQLATNKKRPKAKKFYEDLGFQASHDGMKLYLN